MINLAAQFRTCWVFRSRTERKASVERTAAVQTRKDKGSAG